MGEATEEDLCFDLGFLGNMARLLQSIHSFNSRIHRFYSSNYVTV